MDQRPTNDGRAGAGTQVPRCLDCGYVLSGLADVRRCPECGRAFDPKDPMTFSLRRPFFGWRYWSTGVLIAGGIGVAVMIVDVLLIGAGGMSVWVTAPLLTGFMCGYHVRAKVYSLVLLSLILLGMLLTGVMTAQIGGVFCVLILAAFALVPIYVGALLGHILRAAISARGYNMRKPLVLALAAAVGLGSAVIERLVRGEPQMRTVSTNMLIARPAGTCFESILFYEEVTHDPPWILKVGLARPIRTTGASGAVGDVKVCLYNKGRLVKRVTEVVPGRALVFDVIEQRIGYERDVRLIGGSFVLAPEGDERTRVTLSTTYRPLLGPRWVWAWGEDYAVHTLHGHVLEGMRLHAEVSSPARAMGAAAGGSAGEP